MVKRGTVLLRPKHLLEHVERLGVITNKNNFVRGLCSNAMQESGCDDQIWAATDRGTKTYTSLIPRTCRSTRSAHLDSSRALGHLHLHH
jgi:hypothetical protein